MKLIYLVKDNKYSTLKQVLTQELNISARLLTKLKKENSIFLNSNNVYLDFPIKLNDKIEVELNFKEDNSNIVPNSIPISIIYEDDAFLIVNKPANCAIHPSHLHYNTSLSNGIRAYFDSIGLKKKIRIVNRLDKDTSGIVIIAKNEYIQESLIQQMSTPKFQKEYIGIVEGILQTKSGTIEAPIARKNNSIIERCVASTGDNSITHYKVLKEFNSYSLISFLLETGRTHQIRVHCQHIGHPILGDTLYGNSSTLIGRQALHSHRISFIHPVTKQELHFEASIPNDITVLIEK